MIGSIGERMLAITLPARRCLERPGTTDTGNRPEGVPALRAQVDEACRAVGRDPAEVERTVAVLVRLPGGAGRAQGDPAAVAPPVEGPPEVIAESLRAVRPRRASPTSSSSSTRSRTGSLEALAPVLELLDRGPDRTFGRGACGISPARLPAMRTASRTARASRTLRRSTGTGLAILVAGLLVLAACGPSTASSAAALERRSRVPPPPRRPRISTSTARSTPTGSSSSWRRVTCRSTRRPSRDPARRASRTRPCSSWTARSRSPSTASAAPAPWWRRATRADRERSRATRRTRCGRPTS